MRQEFGRSISLGTLLFGLGGCAAEPSTEPDLEQTSQSLWGTTVVEVLAPGRTPSVAELAVGDLEGCSGTLVRGPNGAVDRVVSAAHCTDQVPNSEVITCNAGQRMWFETVFGERVRGTANCPPISLVNQGGYTSNALDIVVVVLDRPVTSVAPGPQPFLGTPQWALARRDGDFQLVGRGGDCADLDPDCTPVGGVLRTGTTNQIHIWGDRCDDFDFGFCTNIDLYRANGGVENTDDPYWQAATAPGDSGGPIFGTYGGAQRLVGVTSGRMGYSPIEDDEGLLWAATAPNAERALWLARLTGLLVADVTGFAILGERVFVNDRARSTGIVGGNLFAELGSHAQAPGIYGQHVNLRSGATAGQSHAYDTTLQHGASSGALHVEAPNLPAFVEATACALAVNVPGGPSHHLEPDQAPAVFALPPGDYGDVTIKRGRTLRLDSGGTYTFRSLKIDSQGVLWVPNQSLTRIYVQSGLEVKGPIYAQNTLLTHQGTSGTFIETDVYGGVTFLAPRGNLEVAPGKVIGGALLGKNVTLHQDAVLEFSPVAGPICP